MFNKITTLRRLSSLAISDPNIYTEYYITYNKKKKYFTEYSKTYLKKNKEQHICEPDSINVCTVCRGNGIIFNTKSILDFNYYKLCDNCNGKGYL